MSHNATVQKIYEAFGRGDIPAILEMLSENIDWEYGTAPSHDVPWLQPRRGRAAIMGFFQSLAGIEFHKFQPTAIIEGNNVVVALVDLDATIKKTGKRVTETDEIHVWKFGPDGRVARFRHGVDTHAHVEAWKG